MAFGTLSISDLLAARSTSVADFGEDRTFDAIDALLAAHNVITSEMLSELVDTTTDRQRRVGGIDTMRMERVDELGRVDAQKVSTADTVGFPLDLYAIALQWNRKYMQTHTPAELAAQVQAATTADTRNLQLLVKQAIFTPTNTTGYIDRLVDSVQIAPIKALQNADSAPIMPGPNGEEYNGATHTHYLANATLTAAFVDSVVNTTAEHFASGEAKLYINQAQEVAIRGFKATGEFIELLPMNVIAGANAVYANGSLNVMNVGNRPIGLWRGKAEIWVKPWIPANYLFAWVMGQPKPIVMRERTAGSGAFTLDYEDESYPLRARQIGRECGFGVWNRTNGAVGYIGGGSYVTPTF